MANIEALKNIPEISFIEGKTAEDILTELKADYAAEYQRITGQSITLRPADADTLKLSAAALQFCQLFQYVDRAGKSNLLKYSTGNDLENIAALKSITRAEPSAATTTLRFTLSAARTGVVSIPKGTRATGTEHIYFATTQYAEIPAGAAAVDVPAICTATGVVGNSIPTGSITIMVDQLPYVATVTNLIATQGGADIEDDASLTERTFMAQDGFSTAGPEGAYIYWTKTYNGAIVDVKVLAPSAGVVKILFLMEGGALPEQAIMDGLPLYLDKNNVRPTTDEVIVSPPAEVSYDINMTYYINRSDSGQAVNIQAAVTASVNAYATWQRKIGRDINPSALTGRVVAAGAKRVVIAAPVYTAVPQTSVSKLQTAAVAYGGLEDD